MRSRNLEKWTVDRSAELYGVDNWGGGYFKVTADGKLGITPFPGKDVCVPIPAIIVSILLGILSINDLAV